MADHIDPQQIDALNENLKSLIETMGGVAAKGPGVSKSLGEMAGLGKNANAALGILGSSAASVGSALYKGEKGAKVFSSAIEDASNALTLLVLAIPGLGIAAKVAAVAANLFAKGLNAASKQGDALYKTYQDLQKSGATAADGITGVFNNMQKFGYGIEELDKMVKLVSENSETLAQFSLTAADGTSAFASAMQGIVRDPALKLLGKMPDEVNAAGAAFIRQQTAMGRTQKDIGDNLGTSTKQYIMELDRLQRLTGTSADALQKQQDQLLDTDAYNVYMESLEEQGEQGKAQAEKIRAATNILPEYADKIAAAVAGNVAAQQELQYIAPSLIKNLRDPSTTLSETMNTFNAEAKNAKGAFKGLAGLADTRDITGSFKNLNKAINRTADFDERNVAAAKNAEVNDDATKSLADLDLQNMNSRDALQSFVQLGVAPATKAMDAFAKGTSKATSLLPGAGPAGQNSVAGKLDAMNTAGGRVVPSGAGGGPAGTASDVDKILATIRTRESGSNYGIQAKGSSASGAYQYIDSTWAAMTKKYGMGGEFTHAKDAPKEVQDAIARKNVEEILAKNKGDLSAVPKTWYTGNAQGNMSAAALAANKGLTADQYAGGWLNDYSKISGPNGGYQSQTAGVNPSKSLPIANASTPTAALPTAGDDQHADLLSQINSQLARLNSSNDAIAGHTKKSVQLQS